MPKRHKSPAAAKVKGHFKANPPAKIQFVKSQNTWNPSCAGVPQPRVYYVKHARDNRQVGRYATLVKDSNHYEYPRRGVRIDGIPIPDVVINAGWLYATGNSPCVATKAVVAHSEGCALALYHFEEDSKKYTRVCFLEGDPDSVVWIHPWEINGVQDTDVYITAGTFIDVEHDTSNDDRFKDWRVKPAQSALLDTLNTNATHTNTMDEIDVWRDRENVS